MVILRAICLVGFFLMASGCVTQQVLDARKAETDLIGLSKEAVINCAGAPKSATTLQGKDYWSYDGSSVSGAAGEVSSRSCRATLTFDQNKVTDVSYIARGRLISKYAECGALFSGCL